MPSELAALAFLIRLLFVGGIVVALGVLTVVVFARNRTRGARSFWRWFLENEERLRDYERLPELYAEIARRLAAAGPGLSFEFGAAGEDRYLLTLFGPSAQSLVSRAPLLDWWRFDSRPSKE